MPSTAYKSTGAKLTLSGYTYGMDGRVNYNNPTRTNNTVYFSGVSATARYTGPSGGSFSWNAGWDIQAMVDSNTARSSGYWSGSRSVGNTNTTGTQSFNFSVGANANSINVRVRGKYRNDGWSYTSNTSISIPTLGAPTGMSVSTSLVTKNTARLHSTVSSWGTNATAGDGARLEYKKSSSGTWTNLAYNDPGTHYRNVTGLTPNTKYDLRNYAKNGGGKTNNSSTINFYTLSEVFEAGTIDIQAVSYSVTGAKARPGHYTNYSKIQYRKKGSSTWLNSAEKSGDTFSITLTGLLPSTTYERRFVCRTSAGTTENNIIEFTTLPAAKLVMHDGTIKNAIPRVVHPDGTVKMVKVNHV